MTFRHLPAGEPFDCARIRGHRDAQPVDTRAIEAATLMLLHAIGEDPDRDGLRETPARVARMWQELAAGYREEPSDHLKRSFEVTTDSGIVLQRDIPFYSLCEHHLLPFHGTAHVAYIPNGKVVGLSKMVRLVHGHARQLQVQERLTQQVADAMYYVLDPDGVAVVLRAEHLCMGMRGVRAPGSLTTTSAMRGIFSEDAKARAEVLALLT